MTRTGAVRGDEAGISIRNSTSNQTQNKAVQSNPAETSDPAKKLDPKGNLGVVI